MRVQHHLHGSLTPYIPTCFVRVQHHLSIHSAPALQRALPALTPSYIITRLMTNRSVTINVIIAGWHVRRNRSNKSNYVTNEPVGTEMKGVSLLNFKRQPGKSPFRSHSVQHRFIHPFRRRFSTQTGSQVARMYEAAACWRFSTQGRRLSLGRLTGRERNCEGEVNGMRQLRVGWGWGEAAADLKSSRCSVPQLCMPHSPHWRTA